MVLPFDSECTKLYSCGLIYSDKKHEAADQLYSLNLGRTALDHFAVNLNTT